MPPIVRRGPPAITRKPPTPAMPPSDAYGTAGPQGGQDGDGLVVALASPACVPPSASDLDVRTGGSVLGSVPTHNGFPPRCLLAPWWRGTPGPCDPTVSPCSP